MTSKSHQVDECVGFFTKYDIEGPIEDIIHFLKYKIENVHEKHKGKYSNIRVDWSDESAEIWGTREESEKERTKRLKLEKSLSDLKISKNEKERKEYERLKKKFG